MPNPDLHHLPRLDRRHYQGWAAVHWRMRVEPATPGWLDDRFHLQFRELLVHACVRERLSCPVYCLLPDHLHLMWLGLARASDQLNGIKFLRTYLNRLLANVPLQRWQSEPGVEQAAAVFGRTQPQETTACSRTPPRWRLQPQAFDHVLREEERRHDALARVCFYIVANPVRAGLVSCEAEWPFIGAVVPGYPDLHPLSEGYWELFWRLCEQLRDAPSSPDSRPGAANCED